MDRICQRQKYLLFYPTYILFIFTFCNAKAKFTDTVLFPTPPLQLLTAIIFFTYFNPPFFSKTAYFSYLIHLFNQLITFGAIFISS